MNGLCPKLTNPHQFTYSPYLLTLRPLALPPKYSEDCSTPLFLSVPVTSLTYEQQPHSPSFSFTRDPPRSSCESLQQKNKVRSLPTHTLPMACCCSQSPGPTPGSLNPQVGSPVCVSFSPARMDEPVVEICLNIPFQNTCTSF